MFVACADEGNNERRKETMQDAGENQKPETDKYYIRPKAANDRMKLAQNMGQTVYISGATGFERPLLWRFIFSEDDMNIIPWQKVFRRTYCVVCHTKRNGLWW